MPGILFALPWRDSPDAREPQARVPWHRLADEIRRVPPVQTVYGGSQRGRRTAGVAPAHPHAPPELAIVGIREPGEPAAGAVELGQRREGLVVRHPVDHI